MVDILGNPELMKLVYIIGGGLLIGVPVQILIIKSRKKKKDALNSISSNWSPEPSSGSMGEDFSNESIKSYILQYKSTYPRESIKSALISSGNSEAEVERYLNKFF